MSGTHLTTVSPSRVRISRRVVWVAGCCGPKFRVYRYSEASDDSSAKAGATASNGIRHPSYWPLIDTDETDQNKYCS